MIALNIVIGDRSYRIRVEPSDEEIVRKTLKTINDKIIEFKTQFAGKDMQDYIAMVLVWYASQVTGGSLTPILLQEISNSLQDIEAEIDKAISID